MHPKKTTLGRYKAQAGASVNVCNKQRATLQRHVCEDRNSKESFKELELIITNIYRKQHSLNQIITEEVDVNNT